MKPPAVENIEAFWVIPPPKQSLRCTWWLQRIEAGWSPNRRLSNEGYYSSAKFYGVYIWEYLEVIRPALERPIG